jgi:hypothetical protein
MEPFQGQSMLRLALALVLMRAPREQVALSAAMTSFLEAVCAEIDARTTPDKSEPRYRYMEGKWLFTRAFFEDAVRAVGYADVVLIPRAHHATLYRDRILGIVPQPADAPAGTFPGWAVELLDTVDAAFSTDMKRALPLEATIVLRKGV